MNRERADDADAEQHGETAENPPRRAARASKLTVWTSPVGVDRVVSHGWSPWTDNYTTMGNAASTYVFMTCRAGAETALKQELARSQPAWRTAFARPGFVTFKLPDEPPPDERQLAERHWVFARSHGIALGRVQGPSLQQLAADAWALVEGELRFADVHVWQRDDGTSDSADPTTPVTPLAAEIERAIRAAAPAGMEHLQRRAAGKRRPARRKGRVLDVVVIEPDTWWIGYHRAMTRAQRWPGGAIPVTFPKHAVSRAYAKMEEALAWSGLPLEPGDECVELGCAPGGASQALLDRGMFVTGIDPAEVDPAVTAHPRFRHLRKRSKEVRRSEFAGVRWLMADMNLAPTYTLDAAEAIVTHPQTTIRGLVLTLKLADWSLAERLPEFAERVHGWGFRDVRLRQLVTGGREVCLVALRRKALRRISRRSTTRRGSRKAATEDGGGGKTRIDSPHESLAGPHF